MTDTPPKAPQLQPLVPPKADKPVADAGNVYAAILAASANFGALERDSANPYFKSKYLSLPALLKAVREPLSEQGCVITSAFEMTAQGQFVVRTEVVHIASGTSVSSLFPIADPTNPQKVGSAGTYGMRYSLLHLLGIAPEDDDGNSIPNPQQWVGPDPAGQQRQQPMAVPQYADAPPNWL